MFIDLLLFVIPHWYDCSVDFTINPMFNANPPSLGLTIENIKFAICKLSIRTIFIFDWLETPTKFRQKRNTTIIHILIKLANYYYDFIQNRRQKQLKDCCLVDVYCTFYNFWGILINLNAFYRLHLIRSSK